MPARWTPAHEHMCRLIVAGASTHEAYKEAGFKGSPSAASHMLKGKRMQEFMTQVIRTKLSQGSIEQPSTLTDSQLAEYRRQFRITRDFASQLYSEIVQLRPDKPPTWTEIMEACKRGLELDPTAGKTPVEPDTTNPGDARKAWADGIEEQAAHYGTDSVAELVKRLRDETPAPTGS